MSLGGRASQKPWFVLLDLNLRCQITRARHFLLVFSFFPTLDFFLRENKEAPLKIFHGTKKEVVLIGFSFYFVVLFHTEDHDFSLLQGNGFVQFLWCQKSLLLFLFAVSLTPGILRILCQHFSPISLSGEKKKLFLYFFSFRPPTPENFFSGDFLKPVFP